MFEKVYLVPILGKAVKFIYHLSTSYAVPYRASRSMVYIGCSYPQVFLMPACPISFHFEVDLGRCDTKYVDPSKPQDVMLAETHEFSRNFCVQLSHLFIPPDDIYVNTEINIASWCRTCRLNG